MGKNQTAKRESYSRYPSDFAAVGAAFFIQLQERQAAGSIQEEILTRGLSLGRLRLTWFEDSTVCMVVALDDSEDRPLASLAAKSIAEVLINAGRRDLEARASLVDDLPTVGIGWPGCPDLVTINLPPDGSEVRFTAEGPVGMGLLVLAAASLKFEATCLNYAYESDEPLASVVKEVLIFRDGTTGFAFTEVRCRREGFRHFRVEDLGFCFQSVGKMSEVVVCAITHEPLPVVFVNNRQLEEPAHPVFSMTPAMTAAWRERQVLLSAPND
jgi:hypothetical protein